MTNKDMYPAQEGLALRFPRDTAEGPATETMSRLSKEV